MTTYSAEAQTMLDIATAAAELTAASLAASKPEDES